MSDDIPVAWRTLTLPKLLRWCRSSSTCWHQMCGGQCQLPRGEPRRTPKAEPMKHGSPLRLRKR